MKNMMGHKISIGIFSLVFVFFLHATVVLAQQQPRLDLKTMVQKEVKVKKQGKWDMELIPVEKAGRGDRLVYTITYLNTGKTSAVDAQIVNPIPQGTALIPGSAEGTDADVTCSIDNGVSWHKPPVMVRLKNAAGKELIQSAAAESYTHVRWVIKKPVLPGQSGRVSFKTTVK